MRPRIAELWLRLHVVTIHVIEVDAAVLTTLIVNDHSHEEGLKSKRASSLCVAELATVRSICLLIDQIAGVLKQIQ